MNVELETKTTRQIERSYMKNDRNKIYIACEDYDFIWDISEVELVRQLWREGMPIDQMSKTLKRHINEIFILMLDQAELGYIRQRKNVLLGACTL